jgi:Na+-translocating ferredoxin:NAD+ oxidoreductase RnfG subunit
MLACSALAPLAAQAQSSLTQDEALKLAFPAPLQIDRRTAYLADSDVARATQLAGNSVSQRVATYYAGLRDRAVVGVAYFDVHRVRTLMEVVMVVVGPAGDVQRVEILKFMEPPEYHASKPWLEQFHGKQLTPNLSVKRGIANMTGATITSNAVTNAVRRVLAINAVIDPFK